MTAATMSRSLSPALLRRDRVRWTDLAWLVWRQHRVLITVTTLGVAIVAALLWWDAADVGHSHAYQLVDLLLVPAAAGLVGVFWGAPLLAGEYEQRTHLVVWAQDVSPTRWFVAKLTILGGTAVALGAILGAADSALTDALNSTGLPYSDVYSRWGRVGFESWIPLQIMYALFGFVLGAAVSTLVRRTVLSIGLTAVLFAGARFAVAAWRPVFLPPLRLAVPPTGLFYGPIPGGLQLDFGQTVDAAGHPMAMPMQCYNTTTYTWDVACARAHGAVATNVTYQPASRLLPFHLIEFGIFAVLTAALVTFAVLRLRANRVTA